MKYKLTLGMLLLFVTHIVQSQEVFNQLDSEGKRHGKWKGTYPETNKLRYIGEFNHGKEIGMFTYYDKTSSKSIVATREFNANDDRFFVVFYSGKSKVSEGMMQGKLPVGEWRYFHKNAPSLMTLENYVDGKLSGIRKVFYEGGIVAEMTSYKDGLKDGVSKIYNKKGILIEEATYVKGQLDGLITYFEDDGTISIKGQYAQDLPVGVWSYYKNAKVYKEEKKGSRYKKRN